MQPDNEDEAWRAIVENYGERPSIDPDEHHRWDDEPGPDRPARRTGEAAHDHPHDHSHDAAPDVGPGTAPRRDPWDADEDDEGFVPPAPPPVPRTTPDRLAAWAGLFGAPLVLLVALVLRVSLPAWLGYVLVAWFVGGFLYLVLQMPSGPRDPGDDGARL